MSKDEVRVALSVLDLRQRLIFRMAVVDGMRPGEILAIKLGKIGGTSVLVDQRLYGSSDIDTPKGRKSKNTARTVALSPGTIGDIRVWKTFLRLQDQVSYLFPSDTGITPLRPNNVWKWEVRPRLEKVGLGWVNFQVLRRTNASLSRKPNIDDKISADQRGHGLGVSLGVYAISDLDQKIEAVTRLETEVIDAPDNDMFGVEASLDQRSGKDEKKKTEYGVKFKILQVVEKMERETGIEPATNSLEG